MNMFWYYILCYSCCYYLSWFILSISHLICHGCCTRAAAIYSEALGCPSCPLYYRDVLLYRVAEVLADINTDWQRLAWPEDRVPGQQLCPTPEQVCILAWVSKIQAVTPQHGKWKQQCWCHNCQQVREKCKIWCVCKINIILERFLCRVYMSKFSYSGLLF